MVYRGFTVSHAGTIVRVEKCGVPPDDFDDELSAAHYILSEFDRSTSGSTWGCDGIGYFSQKKNGHVQVLKSGVGPRKAKEGFQRLCALQREGQGAVCVM